jgi:hypothetical protein
MKKILLVPVLLAALLAGGAARIVQDQCGPFTDVTPGFCPFVLELYYLGITAGTSATTFSPDDPLTRGQGAVFIAKGLNQSLARSSRRAALGQWWTTTPIWGSAVTTVGGDPLLVACDGQDVWTANSGDSSVSRVRASDGRLLETWTGAVGAFGVLPAMGRIFVTGTTQEETLAGRLYVLDPSQPAGKVTLAAGPLPGSPRALAFDGANLWLAATVNFTDSASLIIVHPGASYPWSFETVTLNVEDPFGIVFDGQNIWFADSSSVSLKKVDSAGTVLQEVPLTTGPDYLVFDGTNLWVDSVAGTLTVVSASTGAILATLSGNGLGHPAGIAFDGSRILVAESDGGVSLWRAVDFAPLGFFPTAAPGDFPFGAASDGINFWVTVPPTGKLARF